MHILTPRKELILPARFGMAGRYRLQVRRPDGHVRLDTGWFDNVITDWGLNAKGTTNNLARWIHVGSGSSIPQVTDTTLETWIASTETFQSLSEGAQASTPYYGWARFTNRFAEGEAAGNISEIGIGPLGGSTDALFSRALIRDAIGNPTAITVLANEFLDATYEIRMYPPTVDGLFNVVDGGSSYDVTVRASQVTGNNWGEKNIMALKALWPEIMTRAYDGNIGPITGEPSGLSDEETSTQDMVYSNNSLEKGGSIFFGLNDGNFTGGIRSLRFGGLGSGGLPSYQAQFEPAIPKDDTMELTIGVKVGWGRASI